MPIRVYYEVLNQKGTPALYSDNFASRPAAGYVGRIFNSPDTGQIFYDTGTTWTLLADAGVGSGSLASVCANGNTTATGIQITAGGLSTNSLTSTNLTAGSVAFIGTGGLFSQDNTNFFWDNTNKRLGINTNTPSVGLDIHSTDNVQIQLNNTSTFDSKIAFLNASVGKWRIGNLYSGGANLFHIYNNAGATLAMQINSSNAALFYGSLTSNGFISAASGITLINGGTTTTAGATNIGGLTAGLSIALASGFNQTLTFPTGVGYTYTFPSATGTLALTSNLGGTTGYLPKYASGTSLGQSLFYDNGTAAYIGATTGGNGLFNAIASGGYGIDVAGGVKFRGDLGVGTPRQLEIFCGGGNEVYFNTSGYGASYSTLMVFQTTNGASVNTNQFVLNQYGNVGIGTAGSTTEKLQVVGTDSTGILVTGGTNSRKVSLSSSSLNFYTPTGGYAMGGYMVKGSDGTALAQMFGAYGGSDNVAYLYYGGTAYNAAAMYINSLNVGIGTSSPTERLDVVGGALAAGNGTIRTGITYSSIGLIGTFTNHSLGFIQNGILRMSIDTNGYLYCQGVYNQSGGAAANVVVASDGSIYRSTSSLKYKKDVLSYDKGLDVIKQLNPVYFKSKSEKDGNTQFAGFIAEEIHNLGLNEFVQYADDGSPDALSYSNMTALLTKGIQQIDTRLTNVEEALLTLQQNLN